MYVYNWVTFLCSRDWHNIVNQLYFNKKFSKKEWNSDTHCIMDKPWLCYAKWNNPDTKGQILSDFTYVMYLEKLNS